jgi:hypothetical protein
MANDEEVTVPIYVAPADWSRSEIRIDGADEVYIVPRTGLYMTSQASLDDLVASALDDEIPLVYLKIPPMGFHEDQRLNNPGAYYPTAALLAEMISALAGTSISNPGGGGGGTYTPPAHQIVWVEYDATTGWPSRPTGANLPSGAKVMWINNVNTTFPASGGSGYQTGDIALISAPA